MKNLFVYIAAIGFVALSACTKMQKPTLSTDDDKTVYAIGTDIGSKLKTLQLSPKELSVLKMGIDDGASNAKLQVNPQEALAKVGDLMRNRQKLFADKEKNEAKAFLDKAAGMPNAQKAESGMIYVSVTEGTGESPKPEDRVKVNYHGTLRNGDVFDSTRERNQPATFRLDRVIKCWTEGVAKMKVGGKSEIYCPSEIAYGDRGAPPKIDPGAALKFEVELLEIIKDDPTPAPTNAAGPKDSKKK